MSAVPTLHIRNVPQAVYDALKRRADRNSRSLNMEVIEALEAFVAEERRARSVLRRLEASRAEFLLPDDAPKPEDVIRELRDAEPRGL
jgi:plasmid stability protein